MAEHDLRIRHRQAGQTHRRKTLFGEIGLPDTVEKISSCATVLFVPAELPPRTFCILPREFSSFSRRGPNRRRPRSRTRFCPSTRGTCEPRFPASPPDTRTRAVSRGRNDGHAAAPTDGSRTTLIGWLQRVLGARRPRVTPDLPALRPLFRSTSRQASVRETPNAEARGCVRRRRTPPVDGRS